MRDAGRDVLPVLPFNRTVPRAPWLLKMHGDARHPSTIVLSRSDFVGYDSRSRPMGSVVQSLLMTKHLLVVGASMTDDNFLRLAHEVFLFHAGSKRHASDRRPDQALGTVVTFRADEAQRRLWEDRFDLVAVSRGGEDNGRLARRLAVFLDAVAMLAAGSHHLVDERYATLLDPGERPIAEAARRLNAEIRRLPAGSSGWSRLAEALEDLGAG